MYLVNFNYFKYILILCYVVFKLAENINCENVKNTIDSFHLRKRCACKNNMSKRQLLLISSSNVYGYEYLEQPRKYIETFLNKNNVKEVLFVPYASKHHDDYTNRVREVFVKWGYAVKGVHTQLNQIQAVLEAEAIFIGGGNSFVLLKSLYDNNLIDPIKHRVLNEGLPYIGSSAGTNVATRSIQTTNDMPIIYPPTFNALRLVPFQINPHYLDTVNTSHQGETREQRIMEFLEYEDVPVLGIREGAALHIVDNTAKLVGTANGRLFRRGASPVDYKPDSDLSFLLKS